MSKYFDVIPESTLQTLDDYVEHGLQPGGFVRAFLANDLMQAIGRADQDNAACLREIAEYIYSEMPRGSHGSYEIVDAWIEQRHALRKAGITP